MDRNLPGMNMIQTTAKIPSNDPPQLGRERAAPWLIAVLMVASGGIVARLILSNAAAQQLCWLRDLSLCARLHTHMGMCRRNDCRQPRAKIARLADRTMRLDCRVLRAFRLLTPSVERPRAARRWWWQLPPGEHQGHLPFRSRSIIDRTELHDKFGQADALMRAGPL